MRISHAFWVLTVIASICCSSGLGQEIAWQRLYGIPGRSTNFNSCAYLGAEGFLLAGVDNHLLHPTRNIFVVRTTGEGDTSWTRRYDFCESEAASSAISVSTGGFLLCGWEYCPAPGAQLVLIMLKINDDGDTLWLRYPGSPASSSRGHSVIQTPDGSFLACGIIQDDGMSGDIFMCRTNILGDTLWTRRLLRPDLWEEGRQVIKTSEDQYLVVGDYQQQPGLGNDFFALLLNGDGDTLWLRTYGILDSIQIAYGVAEATDSGFVIVGTAPGGMQLTKIDQAGNRSWERTYGGIGAQAYAISRTRDGGFAIAGTFLMKVNSAGDSLWSSDLPGAAYAVGEAIDGGIYAAGGGVAAQSAYLTKVWPPFTCGDADASSIVNVSDAIYLVMYIFAGGPAPQPLSSADVNCDGLINISDAVYLVNYIFGGGPEPCAACP